MRSATVPGDMAAARKQPKPARGRPRRAEDASEDILQVRCTREEKARWRAAAEARGVSLGEVVRRYLERWARAGR